jgi:2-C-methyl-D-erythritol 2,4-cyclodiphosphate synthase
MKIGQGFDAHRFALGRALVLGGQTIPFERGLLAHSDGDVLVHALCDALLGAAGLGDIGQHFPDSDSRFKNIDSRKLLQHTVALIHQQALCVSNTDLTIIAQVPKLAPYIEAMKMNIAQDLHVDITQVNIKATTTERMGFTGREEGIAAQAVVLLKPL